MPLSKEEAQALMDACAEDRERRLVTLLLYTGMHPAVLSRRKEYKLDWARPGLLTWERPKTHKLCSWRVPDQLVKLVDEILQTDLGRTTRTYSNIIRRAAARAGLVDGSGKAKVSALTLRHTAVVLGMEAGERPEQVQERLQISSEVLWRHYGKVGK